ACLARLSAQSDVVIGTPVANRGRPEIADLIGFFVNTLALRLDVSGSPNVQDLITRVKQVVVGAQQNQNLPFEEVVEVVRPMRSLAHSPLFQVMLAWQTALEEVITLPGLEVKTIESTSYRPAKFDLTLFLQESNDSIVGGFEYATALFEAGTVQRHGRYFRRLLEALV